MKPKKNAQLNKNELTLEREYKLELETAASPFVFTKQKVAETNQVTEEESKLLVPEESVTLKPLLLSEKAKESNNKKSDDESKEKKENFIQQFKYSTEVGFEKLVMIYSQYSSTLQELEEMLTDLAKGKVVEPAAIEFSSEKIKEESEFGME